MSNLKYDPSKILKVDITKVTPNTWNPKVADTPEYQKVLKSVKVNGLRGAILVREKPNTPEEYEILDGQQRFTAAWDLGFKEIYIYNEGQVDDQLAKELTIWYQQQVPFDRIAEAKLVSELLLEYNDSETLPYTSEELDELKSMAEFDFDQFKDENYDQDEGVFKLLFKLEPHEGKEALAVLDQSHVSREEALMDLIRHGKVRD